MRCVHAICFLQPKCILYYSTRRSTKSKTRAANYCSSKVEFSAATGLYKVYCIKFKLMKSSRDVKNVFNVWNCICLVIISCLRIPPCVCLAGRLRMHILVPCLGCLVTMPSSVWVPLLLLLEIRYQNISVTSF